MSLSYYDVGTPEAPVVSNSSLSALNPEEGGSIRKFLNFFKEKEEEAEEATPSLKNGKLIHQYIENPKQFAIEDFVLPTEMMAGLLKRAAELQNDVKQGFVDKLKGISTVIASSIKKVESAQAEVQQIRVAYEKLSKLFDTNIDDTIRLFRLARIEEKAYSSYGELALLGKIVEAPDTAPESKYLKFLLGSRGKMVLSKATFDTLTGCLNSLNTHPAVSVLLGLRQDDFAVVDIIEVFREQPIYWREIVKHADGTTTAISCKALLDRIIVNHSLKTITYVDPKTTAYSIYTFQKSFERYRYYRQMAFYKRALQYWFTSHYSSAYNFSEYTITVQLVPIETQGLFLTGIYDVEQPWLWKGSNEAKELLHRLAWHMQNKKYRYAPEEMNTDNTYRPLRFTPPQ